MIDKELHELLYDYGNEVEHLKIYEERVECRKKYREKIKALIISNLEKNITPLLLKNRPENELHWGIYLGDSKEEAIAELRENLTKGE